MSRADAVLVGASGSAATSGPTIKAIEFTRRKNWSQSILDELRDLVHVLRDDFGIVYCSPASSELLGYDPSEMMNHLFTEFMHVDDVDAYSREFRAARDSAQPLFRTQFRMHTKNDKYVPVETTGHFHKQCFFGSARVIPVQATDAMDRFLDLKMEHEALEQQLHALEQQQQQPQQTSSNRDHVLRNVPPAVCEDASAPYIYTPGVPTGFDVSESVSLFTGLLFETGERSRGISLGMEQGELFIVSDATPAVTKSVAGLDGEEDAVYGNRRRGKKKKIEIEQRQQPHVCTECGTTDSPEWRKGPMGSKTLCNACGLRWSKTRKKP